VVSGDLNATDTDGLTDTTYFSVTAQGASGTASIDAETGAWTYTPGSSDWYGTDSFTVTVTDDEGGTTDQIVSVTLSNVEDEANITGDTSGSGNEGSVINGDLNATDVDGLTDTTYFTVKTQGTNGTAAIDVETGAWSFTPTDANWFGTDQFTVTVTDDEGGTTDQIVSVTLANVEDEANITGDTSGSGNEGTIINGDLNATDVDGLTDTTYFTVKTQGTNGTAAIDAETGAWSFTPTDANWFGSDSFTITVTDDEGGTTDQIISVTLNNVEDEANVTGDTSGSGNEGTVINGDLNATDVDGLTDTTYFTVKTQGANGTAAIDAETGTWSFTPTDANWFGSDSFTVTVTDDEGGTTDQIVSVTLNNVEDEANITGDTSGSGNEGTIINGDLNATDVDGLTDLTYFTVKTQGANGTAAIDAETGAWSFTPTDANWFGSDSFTVTVTDDEGGTTDQIVSVTLANVEDEANIEPPVIEPPPKEEIIDITDPEPEDETPAPEEEPIIGPNPEPEPIVEEEIVDEDKLTQIDKGIEELIGLTGESTLNFSPSEESIVISGDTDHQYANKDLKLAELFQIQALQDQVTNQANLSHWDFNATEIDAEEEARLFSKINEMSRHLDNDLSREKQNQVEVQVALGSTTGLAAGFISWVLRGGSLLASLMSTVPLLNRFDPLPVVKSRNKEDLSNTDNDDDQKNSESKVDEIFHRTTEKDVS